MVTSLASEPSRPPASEVAVRAHAEQLQALAARHRISNIRFASPGRLLGHFAENRAPFDVIDFEIEAMKLLGAEVTMFSDQVLGNRNVSPDLVAARPL
jgi:hypothetical protein